MNFDLTDEQRMWRTTVHDFVAREVKPKAHEVDENSEFNWPAVRKMGPLGLLGLNIPEEYGGSGVDALSAAIAIEELGWGCGSTALAIAAHNGLGTSPIVLFGTEEQKQQYLPRAASGKSGLGSLALTEPGAGSDIQGGVLTHAERMGEEWVINGSKAWCTNASIADVILPAATSASAARQSRSFASRIRARASSIAFAAASRTSLRASTESFPSSRDAALARRAVDATDLSLACRGAVVGWLMISAIARYCRA